jgi:hypothetical protein
MRRTTACGCADRGVGTISFLRSDFRNNSGGTTCAWKNTSGSGNTTLTAARSRFERSGGGVTNIFIENAAMAVGSGFANCVIHEGSPQVFSMNNNGSATNLRFDFCTVVSRFSTTGDGIRLVADSTSSISGTVLNSIIEGADRALNFEGSGTISVTATTTWCAATERTYNRRGLGRRQRQAGAEPLFVTPTSGNLDTAVLSLQAASPAVDAASLALSPSVTVDYSGVSRPLGVAADMGAYEYGNLSVDVDAEARTITVDGNAADWAGIGSDVVALNTGGRGQLLVNVRFAWDASRLYILAEEQSGDLAATEAANQTAYGAAPYNFDTVALFLDVDNSNNGEQTAQDFSPWFGLSSTSRTDLFAYRANNDGTYVGASLPSSSLSNLWNDGLPAVVEAGLNWSDLALVINVGRQPVGGLAAAITAGFNFGCEPLLVDDSFAKQSFIGGSQFVAPTGLDANSRNIVLQNAPSTVGDWVMMN